MNFKFFNNITTLEELKKEYRNLAKKYHPDISKIENASEIMKQINKEYEYLFEQLKQDNKHSKNENIQTFKNIIDELIKYKGITIDLVGSWVWVYGQTYQIKHILKQLNFRWSKSKKKWYFFDGIEQTKRKRGKKSYKEIIEKYGRQRIKNDNEELKLLLTD